MQGYNKYYPPDYDGTKSLNELAGKGHGLGNRASKIKQGILTVRFEAPFDILCAGCERNIAQGVRFNAEKKRSGSYFSTPIWSFRMKCASCSNWIEIRTDPKNTDYVVTEGARRRLAKEEPETTAANPVLGDDVFADVEQHRAAKTLEQVQNQEIKAIYQANARQWDDTFTQSQKLRNRFRAEKKVIQSKDKLREILANKHSLHIPLVDELESDVSLAASKTYGLKNEEVVKNELTKRLYSSAFKRTSTNNEKTHTHNALDNIATLVNKQSDAFVTPTIKRKKQTLVKPKSKTALVTYSSDED